MCLHLTCYFSFTTLLWYSVVRQKTGKAEAPTPAQMQKVVDVVNETIAKDQACFRFTMPRSDAEGTFGSAM